MVVAGSVCFLMIGKKRRKEEAKGNAGVGFDGSSTEVPRYLTSLRAYLILASLPPCPSAAHLPDTAAALHVSGA